MHIMLCSKFQLLYCFRRMVSPVSTVIVLTCSKNY